MTNAKSGVIVGTYQLRDNSIVTQISANELREEIYNYALAIAEKVKDANTEEKIDHIRWECVSPILMAINQLYYEVEN